MKGAICNESPEEMQESCATDCLQTHDLRQAPSADLSFHKEAIQRPLCYNSHFDNSP